MLYEAGPEQHHPACHRLNVCEAPAAVGMEKAQLPPVSRPIPFAVEVEDGGDGAVAHSLT